MYLCCKHGILSGLFFTYLFSSRWCKKISCFQYHIAFSDSFCFIFYIVVPKMSPLIVCKINVILMLKSNREEIIIWWCFGVMKVFYTYRNYIIIFYFCQCNRHIVRKRLSIELTVQFVAEFNLKPGGQNCDDISLPQKKSPGIIV